MNANEKEELREKIQHVVQKMTKGDIQNLLAFFFETPEIPEVIVISRNKTYVEGFLKLNKAIFEYDIDFWINDYCIEMRLKLKHGKSEIAKRIQIELKEQENEIAIYQTNDKMYLFSVYF